MSRIIDHLYVSDLKCAEDEDFLRENHIKYVLRVINLDIDDAIRDLYKKLNIEYENIDIADGPTEKLYDRIEHIVDYIQLKMKTNQNILVHCFAGASRSVSAVTAFLLKRHYDKVTREYIKSKRCEVNDNDLFKLNDILDDIRSRRSCAEPNLGFVYQLHKYELDLIDKLQEQVSKFSPPECNQADV